MSAQSNISATPISAHHLHDLLQGSEELALLDAREEQCFGERHIFYASCMPVGRLEFMAPVMVPRRSAPVVLCDAGEGLAARAAQRLIHFGYTDVRVLEGGIDGWAHAGFELFSGVNVPSKAFGELVEHDYETPSVSPQELAALRDSGEPLVILDSRPMVEFAARNIPGGACVPGAELALRVHDLAPDPDTLVVVNCAGRTRSIIGAQSLRNAGLPNRVVALRNGTMGWHLAGQPLETGARRTYGVLSADGLAKAQAAAEQVGKRFGVREIGLEEFYQWQLERDRRTLYILDVRSPEEYADAHVPSSRSAPGGQLVQETDHFCPVLRSRIVLVDDNGVRATMTASWLNQMGWPEVVVLKDTLTRSTLVSGREPAAVLGVDAAQADPVSAQALLELMRHGGATVIDLATSRTYRQGHVPGAHFCLRSRFESDLAKAPGDGVIVLTSTDGRLARLAAGEASAATSRPVKVLTGGTDLWTLAGLPTQTEPLSFLSEPQDVWRRPYERDWGVEQAMRDYLTWEVALVEQVQRDGTARFRGRSQFAD
ncbi:MAG: rhodanese-like domain-containing protein [Gammaproteobacteria bacterium]